MHKTWNDFFWHFIKNNLISLSTIVVGFTVLVWKTFIDPNQLDPVLGATLGLLCFMATSGIIDNQRKLDKLHDLLSEETEKIKTILSSLPSTAITKFSNSEKAIEYLSKKLPQLTTSFDHIAIDTKRSPAKQSHEIFFKERIKIVKEGEVRFRYLISAKSGNELNSARKFILKSTSGKFFIGGIPKTFEGVPLLSAAILDNEEVYLRSPYDIGGKETYLIVRNKDIANLFTQWFSQLWASSKVIDPNRSHEVQLRELDSLFNKDNFN